jgi:hypothetical protein
MRPIEKSNTPGQVSRRDFLASALASSLLPGVAASQDNVPTRASTHQAVWMDEWPTVIVGSWDDAPIFRRRNGGTWTWQAEDYHREHSEDTVRKLQELGVTMAIIHFYKGFGLAAERQHIRDAVKLAGLCHGFGIKVGVYVGSTICYEAFLLENPRAEDWFVPNYLGKPVTYGGQTWRKRVYFMHPGYREYIQRVLRVAVEEVQADLIHFDNTSLQAEPCIFHHPLAIEDFRHFLASKYTPEALEGRFGFRDPKYVLPPQCDWALGSIDDPLFQEWTDFRCQTLSRYYQEMAAFIHSLNPAVAVECNPHSGLSGHNTYWFQGVDYPRLLAHTQAVWSEEGNEAHVTEEGVLVSKIRTFKMASKLGNRIFTYTAVPYGGPPSGEMQTKLQLAEAMAYNRQCLGMVGGILSVQKLPPSARRYIQFFHKNFRLFRDVESAADVAVLHSFATLAFNNDRPYQSTWLFEQALIQAQVPFDVIFDQHLNELSKYRVLILADQECLSDEQLESIRTYVKNGGGLVATGWTSLYTPWRELRRDFGLGDLFAVHAPESFDGGIAVYPVGGEKESASGQVRNQIGRGRVVHIPEVKASIKKPAAVPMSSSYWKLPLNWQDLIDAVRWARGGELALEVKAPPTVTVNLLLQRASGGFLIHFVNYDVIRTPVVENIEVRLGIPSLKEAKQISVLTPDADIVQSLPPVTRNGRFGFVLPSLNTYSLVEIL